MRKVIGIGETILDIIFKNGQPTKALPGGSVFNTMISLGRLHVPACFISELGQDKVGDTILSFMRENNITTDYIDVFYDGKSPVSLAFLKEDNRTEYMFYTQYPESRLNVVWPRIDADDILIIGSYYAINPVLRPRIIEFLEYARTRKAIIYYDINFRKSHAHEAMKVMPAVLENLEYADVVKGSDEDFENLFQMNDGEKIYKDRIKFYCPHFIYTGGEKNVELYSGQKQMSCKTADITPVSTIGAGDNFNAGFIFGLLKNDITRERLAELNDDEWKDIIDTGISFASEVCQSYENYISPEFAQKYSAND
ncbi:MAG: carbohydrate kinase [Coprobacter sp.]|nr:carbohydrate kinase [Coprobacter sp.]